MPKRAVNELCRVRQWPATPRPNAPLRQGQSGKVRHPDRGLEIDPGRYTGGNCAKIDLKRPDGRKGHQGMNTPASHRDVRGGGGAQTVADQCYRAVTFHDVFDDAIGIILAGELPNPLLQAGAQPQQMQDILPHRPPGMEAADENDGILLEWPRTDVPCRCRHRRCGAIFHVSQPSRGLRRQCAGSNASRRANQRAKRAKSKV